MKMGCHEKKACIPRIGLVQMAAIIMDVAATATMRMAISIACNRVQTAKTKTMADGRQRS